MEKIDIPPTNLHCCWNCAFLRRIGHSFQRPVHCGELEELFFDTSPTSTVLNMQSMNCFHGNLEALRVYDWPKTGLDVELAKDRTGECLFFKRNANMSFETARELERREADRLEADKDREQTREAFRLSKKWFKITIITLVVSIVISGITLLRGCEPTQMEITKPVQIAPTTQPVVAGE